MVLSLPNLPDVLKQYGIRAQGVIHIGAHTASEIYSYSKIGIQRVLWVEGNPRLMDIIYSRISQFSEHKAFNILVSDVDDVKVKFNISKETQNSSILDPLNIQVYYPATTFEEQITMRSSRMDSFLNANNIRIEDYNIINIDIQGAELKALKGFGELLYNVDCINSEVNYTHLYRNGVLMHQLDLYLASYSLLRVKTELTKRGWGDALYVRVPSISFLMLWSRVSSAYLYALFFRCITGVLALVVSLNVHTFVRSRFPSLYAWLLKNKF